MVGLSQLRQAGWTCPMQPVFFKDHDIAVRFGDEAQDTAERPRPRAASEQKEKRSMSSTVKTSSVYLPSAVMADDFDSVLMAGLQELHWKILQQHRLEIETVRAPTPTFLSASSSMEERVSIPLFEKPSGRSSDCTPATSHGSPTSPEGSVGRTLPPRTSTKSVKFGTSEVSGRRNSGRSLARAGTLKSKKSGSKTWTFPIRFNIRQEWLPQAICRDPLALQQSLAGCDTPGFNSAYSIGREQLGNDWKNHKETSTEKWRLMLHPRSPVCLVWLMMSLLLLSYDGIMVPMDVCFELENDFIEWIQFLARLYWTLDIVLRFATGITVNDEVEMNPKIVFCVYIRSWFFFDLALVAFEWIMIALRTLGEASLVSLLRSVRWLRMLRILRLLRVLRFAKVNSCLHELIVLSSDDLNMTKKLLKAIIYYLIFLHVATCTWYFIGDAIEGGWVAANGLNNSHVFHRYIVSLHWLLSRLQGYSRYNLGFAAPPTAEMAADCVMTFICLLVSSWFMAIVIQVVLAWAASNTAQHYRLAKSFMDRHHISRPAKQKTLKFLQANQVQGPGEVMYDEGRLMSILPSNVQNDLHYEVRAPLLCTMSVFWNLHTVSPRCIRHLTHEALFDQLVVESETVFGNGDACSRMYVVRSGKFKYSPEDSLVLSNTPRQEFFAKGKYGAPNKSDDYDVLVRGQLISEAALWTFWEHMGELSAMTDGLLMNLECATFFSVIAQHKMACVFACKYARHFTWSLNRSQHCDLIGFDFTLSTLDQSFGAGHDHFIFITHYKMEAGTEATLMRDLLEPMIRMDSSLEAGYLRSPIFIDSEDLADLTTLKKHVEGSDNLIVLLTPDVLTRPYCLLELVTAWRNGVQLVPVEVQRPGLKYKYPSEEFYKKLRNGKVISPEGMHLLKQEGCSLSEVEEAISMLFLKIALPFSPHKSNNIRHAELADILTRCQVGAQPVNRSSQGAALGSTFNFASFGLESADENGGLEEFSMTLAICEDS